MNLNDVHRGIQRRRSRRRIGRGSGSGVGKTCGRGHKGQGSRSGVSFKAVFQGGTMPLVRRIPKRGFNNQWAKTVAVVNVGDLQDEFNSGEEVTLQALAAKDLAKGHYNELKILGNGELTKKLKVSAHRFSKSASEKITKAGGEVIVLAGRTPVEEKKKAVRGTNR